DRRLVEAVRRHRAPRARQVGGGGQAGGRPGAVGPRVRPAGTGPAGPGARLVLRPHRRAPPDHPRVGRRRGRRLGRRRRPRRGGRPARRPLDARRATGAGRGRGHTRGPGPAGHGLAGGGGPARVGRGLAGRPAVPPPCARRIAGGTGTRRRGARAHDGGVPGRGGPAGAGRRPRLRRCHLPVRAGLVRGPSDGCRRRRALRRPVRAGARRLRSLV
ncbi:MAG: hypothetical protein AVDCRST_MAG20-157, partial [uncultured Acidimicrobiales bacterium]